MAGSQGAQDLTAKTKRDAVSDHVGRSAADAVERLQRAAETLAADAERLARASIVDPPATSHVARPGFAVLATGKWGRAAAASAACVAIAAAAILGLRDGAPRGDVGTLASIDHALPWKQGPEASQANSDLRAQVRDLSQEVRNLRAQAQKQAEEARSAQAHENATMAAAAQTTARLDGVEHATTTKLDQMNARVERIERLTADPIVTSAIAKSGMSASPNPNQDEAKAPAGGYRLRGVHNGVATIQTWRGLIEVGPGDRIPGVGRVRSIEKVDGRWVVVMRHGVIDSD